MQPKLAIGDDAMAFWSEEEEFQCAERGTGLAKTARI